MGRDEARSPIQDLVAQRALLRALALRMSGRREDADELVQEALLVAMERPPQHGGDTRAWVRGVLRRLWFRRRGHLARSRAAELDPALPADTSPAGSELERAEVAGSLSRLVLELEEPYRTVVCLRFYEDRSPSEIAELLGRPVNTVTSQLARGLARLRERLERRADGRSRRGAWLVWPGRRPEERDEHPGPSCPRARTGRLVLASRILAAAAVAFVSAALLVERAPREREPRESAAAARVAAPRLIDPPDPGLARVAREVTDSAAAPPLRWIELELVDHAGDPVAGVSLEFTRPLEEDPDSGKFTYAPGGETDSGGKLRFAAASNAVLFSSLDGSFAPWNRLDWIGLRLKKEGQLESDYHWYWPSMESTSLRLQLRERAAALRGRIQDAEGRPVQVWVLADFERLPEPRADGSLIQENVPEVPSDPEGAYELAQLAPGFRTVWYRALGLVPRAECIELARGVSLERDVVLHRGASLAGRVVDAQGVPVQGARVQVRYRGAAVPFPKRTHVLSGPDGAYAVDGLHFGPVLATAVHPADAALTDAAFLDARREEEREWVPVLREREPLRVRVRTGAGRALGRCIVRVTRADPADGWSATASADPEGLATLAGLPEGEPLDVEVFATFEDSLSTAPPVSSAFALAAGPEVHELVVPDARLGRGTLTGRLVLSAEEPAARTRLYLRAVEGRRWHATFVSEHAGAFRRELSSQRYVATIVRDGRGALELGDLEILAGETLDLGEIRLPRSARVEIDWRWSHAFQAFELVALADGAAPASAPGACAAGEWLVVAGSQAVPATLSLLPGRYRWSVTGAERLLEQRTFDVRPGEVFVLTTGPAARSESRGR